MVCCEGFPPSLRQPLDTHIDPTTSIIHGGDGISLSTSIKWPLAFPRASSVFPCENRVFHDLGYDMMAYYLGGICTQGLRMAYSHPSQGLRMDSRDSLPIPPCTVSIWETLI